MQTFKVPELFFSPILSHFSWCGLIGWSGVKHVYHVTLTFPFIWLHLFLSDPSGPKSVCRKVMLVCHLSIVSLLYGYDTPTTRFV